MVETNVNLATPDLLRAVDFFNTFDSGELNQLLQRAETKTVEAHTNIIIEGDLSSGMYVVLDGIVGVYKANQSESKSYDVAQLSRGKCFGEMSLVDDHPRSATVKAMTPATLLYISKEFFNAFLNQSNARRVKFYEGCIRNLVSRLRELNDSYVITQFQLWKSALGREGEAA